MNETMREVFAALLESWSENAADLSTGSSENERANESLRAEWLARFDAADGCELAELRQWKADQLAEREAMQGDVRELLLAVGLEPGPRPKSPHLVVVEDVLPRVRALAEVAADGWISVEERLPEESSMPWLCLASSGRAGHVMAGYCIADYTFDKWHGPFGDDVAVTHWRPLPERPVATRHLRPRTIKPPAVSGGGRFTAEQAREAVRSVKKRRRPPAGS